MKTKLCIMTIALAVCGIIAIFVVNTENLQENTFAKIVDLKKPNKRLDANLQPTTTDPKPSVPRKSAQTIQIVDAQPHTDVTTPSLNDVRTLNIIDKLNSLDGNDNAYLRLALALNEDYSFQAMRTKQDRKGNLHTRYRQSYRDIPIWGAQVLVHKGSVSPGAASDYYAANGKYASGLEFSELDSQLANIDRSENALKQIIRAAKKMNQHLSANWTTRNAKSELVLYIDKQGRALPAYAVSYLAFPRTALPRTNIDALSSSRITSPGIASPGIASPGIASPSVTTPEASAASQLSTIRRRTLGKTDAQPTRPHMLIAVASNKVLKQWEGLNTAEAHGPGGNEKTGRYEYGTDYPALVVAQAGDTCTLNNHKVKTVDLNNTLVLHDKAHSFTCPENNHKEINGAYSPLNDAHFFGGLVFDMYQAWFQLPPLNFQLTMAVHYSKKFNSAAWTGEEVLFGDGQNRFYPLVDVNVTAHEISHGFTEQNAGLIYENQSGGINEAFSDIAGEAAEFYWKGEVDWLVGTDILIGEGIKRSFANPRADGTSIDHADAYNPGRDVHHSSGIYNRAFYLLANTANWDVRKAFEVFVLANQSWWVPNETFAGGACGVLNAANDLGYEVRDVDQAFQTVGVNCGLVPFTDSDRDGMDNLWEIRFGLNALDPSDAYIDSDGDGLANAAEYYERTHPQNPDSDGDGISDFVELYNYGTNPNLVDSDYDGLGDYAERETWLTDPARADTDKDGMPDGWEVKFGLAPRNPDGGNDMDGDGVSNLNEFTHHADPTLIDTDGDGLDDYMEINTYLSSPQLQDSDFDLLNDADELEHGTDPNSRDSDSDYLGDGKEIEVGSDPSNPDSDNDSLPDGDEVSLWLTSPLASDTDFDGMPDNWEVLHEAVNPRVADSDQDADEDGLTNLQEYAFSSNPARADTDSDGLNDYTEIFEAKTDPNNPDTDDDTLSDAWEFENGLDPLDIEDAYIDSDGDGWLNIQEYALGTHPLSATAKPRVPDEARLEAEKNMTCSKTEDWNVNPLCLPGTGGVYGWDAILQRELVFALSFNYSLPWTIASTALNVSATSSSEEESLAAVTKLVYLDIPDSETEVSDWDAWLYWEEMTIFSGWPVSIFPIQVNQLNEYEIDIDPRSFTNSGSITLAKSVDNLQKRENIDELVFEEPLSNHLIVKFAPDTDDDGITDDWEMSNGLDPENAADALLDRDEDGAINLQEFLFGIHPDYGDSDFDGMPDGWEIRYGLNPTDFYDAYNDQDNDGRSNLDEYRSSTSPLIPDSNGGSSDESLKSAKATGSVLENKTLEDKAL